MAVRYRSLLSFLSVFFWISLNHVGFTLANGGDRRLGVNNTAALSSPKVVLLVPGIAGSGLFASEVEAVIPFCGDKPVKSSPYRVWASLSIALVPRSHQRCWASTLKCLYNDKGVYTSQTNVTITPEAFGHTRGFAYLDYIMNFGVYGTKYMADFVEAFVSAGYVEGDTLLGFPYDWRMPPWQLQWQSFIDLIEDAVKRHNGPVQVVAHSLGAASVNYFLNALVDKAWKDAHIHSFVPVGGAFGGSPKIIRAMISGYNDPIKLDLWNVMNISLVPIELLRMMHRTWGAMYSLTPNAQVYGPDRVIVEVVNDLADKGSQRQLRSPWFRNSEKETHIDGSGLNVEPEITYYTVSNWSLLLPPRLRPRVEQATDILHTIVLQDPEVPVHCFWSRFDKPSTEIRYTYNASRLEKDPNAELTYGDDTLPVEAISYCSKWASTLSTMEFANLDHMHMFTDRNFTTTIVERITNRAVKWKPKRRPQ